MKIVNEETIEQLEYIAVWLMLAMEAQGNYETDQAGAMKIARDYAALAREMLEELGVEI